MEPGDGDSRERKRPAGVSGLPTGSRGCSIAWPAAFRGADTDRHEREPEPGWSGCPAPLAINHQPLDTPLTEYPGKKSPSWIPIGLAVGLPALAILLALLFAQRPAPVENGPMAPGVDEPLEQAYITIALVDREDEPLEGREVVFRHERPDPATPEEALEETFETRTDAAGMATVSLDKIGDVTINVEGRESPHRLRSLERSTENTITIELVADR